MSFATFQVLPNKLGNIPEFRPLPVPEPPVYNTTAAITPLLKLADYLSPRQRAIRQAATARANYEYKMYMSGQNPNKVPDPFFAYKLQHHKNRLAADAVRLQKLSQGFTLTPAQVAAGFGGPKQDNFGPQVYYNDADDEYNDDDDSTETSETE